MIQRMLAIWSLVPLPFLNPAWIWKFMVHILLNTGLENFEQASLVVQTVKNLPVMQETWLDPWVGKMPSRKEQQPTPVFLPGEFHEQRSLASYSSWGRKRVGHEWATNTFTFASLWDEYNCVVVWTFFVIALWDWNENWPFPVLWPLLSFPILLKYCVQHFNSIIFEALK